MKITAAGGYNAVGRNMTGVTIKNETVAVDNGIRLDTFQMYDGESHMILKYKKKNLINMRVIPDYDSLKNVKAQVISHGHLDHVGALPITKPEVPIISTHYTAEIARKEYKKGNYYSRDYGDFFKISKNFGVEFVEVTHSIPESSIVVLKTSEGNVVYACDFRLDDSSEIARTDYEKLKKIAREGVYALIVESTRVKEKGKTPSEIVVREKFREIIEFIDSGLVIATTFATHIERIQMIMDIIERTGKIPIILGRSMNKHIGIAEQFGLMDLPPNAKVHGAGRAIKNILKKISGMKKKERNDYFLLVTGNQGEPQSILPRMINGDFLFNFQKNDSVIFCADTIPVPINETNRYILETKLESRGVRLFKNVHVSGHASREDHRKLLNILSPEHIIPCHGDMVMKGSYAGLAAEEGYELNKNIHLINNGQCVEI